jgi:superfamily II DNA/RNA helicase
MLAAACGLEAPTKVQSSAWALATEEGEQEGEGGNKKGERKEKGNRNLLIVAPPGAGKTLAYLLPAAAKVVMESEEDGSGDDDDDSEDDGDDGGVDRRRKRAKKASSSSCSASLLLPSPRVLVLVPTRELARQVAAAARPLRRAAGLKVVRVAGGDRREDQVDRLRASSRGKGGSSKSSSVHVLVATPGRLLDLVRGGDVGLGELGVFFLFFCPRFVRARPDTFSSFLNRAEASRAHSRLMRFAPRPLPPYPRPRD